MEKRQLENADLMDGDAPRRVLINPFVAPTSPYQLQQQPSSNYLQYPMPMEPSIQSYTHQEIPPGRYWQAPAGIEPLNYGKQGRHGGSLELGEIAAILDSRSFRSGHEGAGVSLEASSDMNMTSFDVNSLRVTGSTGDSMGDTGEFHPSAAVVTDSMSFTTAVESTKTHFTMDPETTPTTGASTVSTTSALVDAAYTQFSEPSNPKLKVEKIAKNTKVKCTFPDCPNRARVSQYYGDFCNRHVIVAPCGFPGCRDKAMDRAAMCVKHLELGKEGLQEILNVRTQNVPVCRTTGCFKNDQGRGYCRGHEKLMMATGHLPLHINKRCLNSAYTMCSYPECTKYSQRHHLCRTHGNLLITQAQELANRPGATESYDEILAKMQKDMRRCTHENCMKNSQRDRLCTTHLYEKHNLQKNSSTPGTGAALASKKNNESSQHEDIGGAVERTRCSKLGCGNLLHAAGLCAKHTEETQNLIPSQEQYYDPISSGSTAARLTADDDSGKRQPLSSVRDQPQIASVWTSIARIKCTNPICDRESNRGRDYCDVCQDLFLPVVTPMHENSAGSWGFPFKIASGGIAQPEENISLCRVANCGQESAHGGLCASHFQAFKTGSLSVDEVKLNSQTQTCEWEVAANSSASGKGRKQYYCKVDGCDKPTQKRNLCKCHHRLHEGISTGKTQPEIELSSVVTKLQQSGFSPPTIACHFPGCPQLASTGILLCLVHLKATFCWRPGCENLVERHQFCEFHAFRKQCAYEGCMYSAVQHSSGCQHHAKARRCRHEFCDKFAVGMDHVWCRLHQINCQDFPCVLCRLHAPSLVGDDENTNRNQYNVNVVASTSKDMCLDGGDPFSRSPRQM